MRKKQQKKIQLINQKPQMIEEKSKNPKIIQFISNKIQMIKRLLFIKKKKGIERKNDNLNE